MSEPRINYVNILTGQRGCGKTTYIRTVINDYRALNPGKKVLVMDTLDHPKYRDVPAITVDHIRRWKHDAGGFYRIYGSNFDEIFAAISENLYNALVVHEDAYKYIEDQLPDKVRDYVIDSKQQNLDIIFMYHGFAFTPPRLFKLADNLTMLKCDDPVCRKSVIGPYDLVRRGWEHVQNSSEPWPNVTVRIN